MKPSTYRRATRVIPASPAALLCIHANELGLEPATEHRFAPPRRWRFDVAIPTQRIAVEIEGGVWTGGRHTRGAGYVKDLEKYNRATVLGWRVLRFTPEQVLDGTARETLAALINQEALA